MATQAVRKPASEQPLHFEQRVQKLREIYADATEISKTALENVIRAVQSGGPATEFTPMESAGRIGARRGKVSELTTLRPIKPAAAKRMRAFLELLHGNLGNQGRGQGRHRSRHAFRLPGQRHEAALLHRLRRRLGSLHRRLRRPRSPTSWTFSSAKSKVGRGFAARRSKTSS